MQVNQIDMINEVNEMGKPSRETENVTAEETVELVVIKGVILEEILQIKFTIIENGERS